MRGEFKSVFGLACSRLQESGDNMGKKQLKKTEWELFSSRRFSLTRFFAARARFSLLAHVFPYSLTFFDRLHRPRAC